MEAIARGSCSSCGDPQVYMVWRNGRRILIIQCDCGVVNNFDVENLEAALGSNDPIQQMMDNFHPTGKPS